MTPPPPKIEVLSTETSLGLGQGDENVVKLPKRNPFAETKKKTVKRDPKYLDLSYRDHQQDLVKQRHGLNVPDYVRNTPLDLLFADLETKLMSKPLEELTLDLLCHTFAVSNRISLIKTFLDSLLNIQKLSNEEKLKFEDQNLISISLHDIKTFSRLINVIIVHGMYPALSYYKVGIPLDKRRLKSFTTGVNSIHINPVTLEAGVLLFCIFENLLKVFEDRESDVTNLLLRGTGYSDFLTITLVLLTMDSKDLSDDQIKLVRSVYQSILDISDTYELYQTFSLLLSSTTARSPFSIKFKAVVTSQLQQLPYNAPHKDGLHSLIEFVCDLRNQEEIDAEKFDHVANVVLSKPKSISVVPYFSSIGQQMYDLLVNINRPVVNSCVCFVLEKLWLKNQLVVKDFFMKLVWLVFSDEGTEVELNNVINVLISISKGLNDSQFIDTLFTPVIVSLWLYLTFLKSRNKPTGVVKGILISYFSILFNQTTYDTTNGYNLDLLVKNLVNNGGEDWEYTIGPNELPKISLRSKNPEAVSADTRVNKFLQDLDVSVLLFIELLEDLDDQLLQQEFVTVLERWLKLNQDTSQIGGEQNPFFALIDMRVLEEMANKFKEDLAKTPKEILIVVSKFLKFGNKDTQVKIEQDDVDSDDEDEDMDGNFHLQTLPILLQLLSAIVSETLEFDDDTKPILKEIVDQLKQITGSLKPAADSICSRIGEVLEGNNAAKPQTLLQAQKVKLQRAVTGLNDPLVPIRAHALHLLRELIVSKSEIVSLDFVIELHMIQLKDPEPFIYLNVIKGLQELIAWNPTKVLNIYAKIYTDAKAELDERLRIGEVLLRFVQLENELFAGECAKIIVESAILLVRRDTNREIDDRLRNSAMSLLGICCLTNPLGFAGQLNDVLDCAIGILQLESTPEKAIMRRAAVVLLNDLIIGTSQSSKLPFPESYRNLAWNSLNHIATTDSDLLVREQATSVIKTIEELAKLGVEEYEVQRV